MLDVCRDEDLANLIPYILYSVGPSALTQSFDALLLLTASDSLALRWQIGGPVPYKPPKDSPVADQILSTPSSSPLKIPLSFVPIDLTSLPKHSWVYIVVESFLSLPHPLHLHGHDMSMMKGPRREVARIWSGEREEMKRGCEGWRGSGLEGRE